MSKNASNVFSIIYLFFAAFSIVIDAGLSAVFGCLILASLVRIEAALSSVDNNRVEVTNLSSTSREYQAGLLGGK